MKGYTQHQELLQFKSLLQFEQDIKHCFTTRLGGVSKDECASLNLGFNRKDSKENVLENYKRVAGFLGVALDSFVLSNQVHDNRVKDVIALDRGKGITKESDIIGYDGLITNQKGITLVTFYADCVPLFFYDPIQKVIATSHSGWKSTLKEIAKNTLEKMTREYRCDIEQIRVVIGPSIQKCCFEVEKEVNEAFLNKFSYAPLYSRQSGPCKWHIDLQGLIKNSLVLQGIKEKHIEMSSQCTKCNHDVFFSYRGDKGKTGSQAAMIQLK